MNDEPLGPGTDVDARLRAHLAAAAGRLGEPPGRLEAVRARARRRQIVRGTLATVAVAALVAVPVVAGLLDRPAVVIEPGPDPASPTGAPSPTPHVSPTGRPTGEPRSPTTPTSQPSPSHTPSAGDSRAVAPQALGSPVLAYGDPTADRLDLVDGDGARMLWPEAVQAAFADGRGGVVLQPSGQPVVVWLPDASVDAPVRLAEADGDLLLRGVMRDGRAVYSVSTGAGAPSEGDTDEFFTVALSEDAASEPLAAAPAYETATVGPVLAAGGAPVHASCHIHCSLWAGLPGDPDGEAIYHGGGSEAGPAAAIAALTATPDGRVLGFVEFDPGMPDLRAPELVLLDGASFAELARVEIAPAGVEGGAPTLSLSADGQRALVTLGGAVAGSPDGGGGERAPFVVQAALSAEPQVSLVDFGGSLAWAEPSHAVGAGAPVTDGERQVAEALLSFAREPDEFADVPLADEVVLGLGSDLLGSPQPAGELSDGESWSLDPPDGFRARVGPFSALETLAGAGDVQITSGAHRRCVSPPTPPPGEVGGLRQVSIQPAGTTSCLEWFAVDLFLTEDGRIVAVTLDLFEP